MVATQSFEIFFAQHRDRLVATLAGLTGDLNVATDAVDEAMTRAYARWRRVGAQPEPAAWVFVTARNVARRQLRSRPAPAATAAAADPQGGEIWMLVADLSQRQREAIVLRHIVGLTERGVGEAMGITRGTVSSTLRDAYRHLEAALQSEGEQHQ